jgi:hypothetical protein
MSHKILFSRQVILGSYPVIEVTRICCLKPRVTFVLFLTSKKNLNWGNCTWEHTKRNKVNLVINCSELKFYGTSFGDPKSGM